MACAIFGFLLSRANKKIKILLGGADSSAESLPQDLIRRLTKTEIRLDEMSPRLEVVEAISNTSVQKVGFIRFNPFQNTGGDNSFIIALLDGKNNGVLISSLYMREGVRVYAKQIENGVSRHPLSEEEKKVLRETMAK